MTKKISIIIPAYNLEGYIDKCLESICDQTFPADEMEIIIVDDGSSDNTPKILDDWAQREDRIRVIHKLNSGVSAARNDGIKAASGEFIFFFDGDDFMKPETCMEIYQLAKDKDVDSVIYGYYRYEEGRETEECLPMFEKDLYEGKELVEKVVPQFVGLSYENINAWLRHEDNALYVENPALWRIMVKRQIIVDNSLEFDVRLKVGEDTVFISEYLSCARRVYVQQKCYYYLVTRQTSTIFVYERKAMQKLQGKINLLDGRSDLTRRIIERTGYDITKSWAGTVVMSAVEVGFLMTAKNKEYSLRERYKAYKNYVTDNRVVHLIDEFVLDSAGGVKRIPFLLLKWKWHGALFGAITLLHMVHYEFNRN